MDKELRKGLVNLAVLSTLAAIPLLFCSKRETDATVTGVGEKGITVSYADEYGEKILSHIRNKNILVSDPSELSIGSIVNVCICSNPYHEIVYAID